MIVEYEGKNYETIIGEDITEGDLYVDCIENTIKVCNQYICLLPWSLKIKEIENEED